MHGLQFGCQILAHLQVMGRVASHLALEVALQTHAHMTLIGEDLADYVDTERLAQARERQDTDFSAYGDYPAPPLPGDLRRDCPPGGSRQKITALS